MPGNLAEHSGEHVERDGNPSLKGGFLEEDRINGLNMSWVHQGEKAWPWGAQRERR